MNYGQAIRTPGTKIHTQAQAHAAMLRRVASMTPAQQTAFWANAAKATS